MANSRKKISELPALSVASLDTTFVLGISGSTTYKISINNLTSSLDTTFATDLVTNALSSSLNGKLSTSSFNSYTQSFTASVASGTISGSSQLTSSFDTRYTLNGSVANVNTASLVSRLNAIENVSGSWITESETGSFLTSLSGAISSSTQISDLGFVTGSYTTINSFNSLTQSFNSISQSFNVISGSVVSIQGGFDTGSYQTFTSSVNTSISNLNTFTASQSTSSLVNRLNTIESVSGSWITESETGSFLTSLNGAISSSAQITAFGFISSSQTIDSGSLLTTSSFNSYTASISTASLVTSISNLNTFTASVSTASLVTSITNLNSFTASENTKASTLASYTASVNTTTSSLNAFTSSINSWTSSFSSSLASSITSVSGTFTNLTVNGQPTTYGVVNGSYLLAQNNAEQTGVGNGTAISFQTTNASNGSLITKGSNTQVTLTAGNTYKLEAIIRRFTSTSTWGAFRWYDVTNSTYVGIEAFGEVVNSTGAIGSTLVATHYVTPSVNTTYELRQTTANTITVSSAYASIEITHINPTIAFSGSSQLTSFYDGRYTLSGSVAAGTISGSSQLTSSFPSKTTGAWSVPAGASTQSFTVEQGASYTMWVNGNIPNGIITWNATVTTSNTNVPVVGSQYGWYYTAGNTLVLTAMPDQIIGTTNTIISSPTSYALNTSNVFKFGITNNSGTTQTINYGYIKLS